MKTSDLGIDLIKKFEGYRPNAYFCPAGVLTIGYGHTATVKRGDTVDRAGADVLLRRDLARFESAVNALGAVLLQHQFDALVSLAFNIGVSAFAASTIARLVRGGDLVSGSNAGGLRVQAAEQFGRWVYAGKRRLPGLVRRRQAERSLFLSGRVMI